MNTNSSNKAPWSKEFFFSVRLIAPLLKKSDMRENPSENNQIGKVRRKASAEQ